MDAPTSGTLAVELHPHSPTHWIATYYPMVHTPAGRWADVTWPLHQHLIPLTGGHPTSARWLEASSPDPHHLCYDHHPLRSTALAAGYATETASTTKTPLAPEKARRLRATATVVPAGQLTEWLLDDLQDLELRTRSCRWPPGHRVRTVTAAVATATP
ncbi:hypothetical protein [Kocuria rosea]|uniref:hypothetical protein n=1 Tax=Kocuria rosea TaxID=1275 RepID=UPI003017255F